MKYWIGIVLLATLSFSACNSEPATEEEKRAAMIEKMMKEGKAKPRSIEPVDQKPLSELGNTSWTLTQLTFDGKEFPLANENPQPLRFSGWNLSAGTCPRFGGRYDVPSEGQFEAKELRGPATGECDPSEAALSRRLRGVLESATSYELFQDGQQLKISGEKGVLFCAAS